MVHDDAREEGAEGIEPRQEAEELKSQIPKNCVGRYGATESTRGRQDSTELCTECCTDVEGHVESVGR